MSGLLGLWLAYLLEFGDENDRAFVYGVLIILFIILVVVLGLSFYLDWWE